MKLTLAYYNYGTHAIDLVQIPKVINRVSQEQIDHVADVMKEKKLADKDVGFMGALKVDQNGYVQWAEFEEGETPHKLEDIFK